MKLLERPLLLGAIGALITTAIGAGCTTEQSKVDAGGPTQAVSVPSSAGGRPAAPSALPSAYSGPDWSHATCEQFNDGGGCSETQQRIFNSSPACYGCLANAGCLNTAKFNDIGHECSDVLGAAARGAKQGTKRSALCLATLDCILSKGCASVDVALCYCGSLGAGNNCTTAKSGANGACRQQEVDGLEHMATDTPKDVTPDYFNRLLGAGAANEIFTCGKSNSCEAFCRH